MRSLGVLSIIAVALARPQGYNYAHPIVNTPFFSYPPSVDGSAAFFPFGGVHVSQGSGTFGDHSSVGHSHFFGGPTPVGVFSGYPPAKLFHKVPQSDHLAPSTYNLGSTALSASNAASSQALLGSVGLSSSANAHTQANVNVYTDHGHQKSVVTKSFHSFAAPEESEEEVASKLVNLGPAHKHYRVIFIKAPYQNHQAAALTIAQAAKEEKTIIYVLSKKPDLPTIHSEIIKQQHVPTKPEVYFIKYKTPEEAAHAQRVIQAKYDTLGGSTQISDEGIAPVTSVVGTFDSSPSTGPANSLNEALSGESTLNVISETTIAKGSYLPPQID